MQIPTLKRAGVNVPVYSKDSWEIDWSRRDGKKVLARNPHSKMPLARDWHWIEHKTLDQAGIKWMPKNTARGRYVGSNGYMVLSRIGMSQEEIKIAEVNGLFLGKKKGIVVEHRLVAAKKYGTLKKGEVVRHINGIKTDNRPENIVVGTTQENTMDHNSARLMNLYWRDRCLLAEREIRRLLRELSKLRSV